ncbi:MAG TPA: glycoside hydrolase family 25 protein [Chthoniobacterales bacterium]|nr:glycoside hydrolase family 25 protein [Chthoniobacterales bacterium]
MKINPLVIDLSHYDPVQDWDALKASGVIGIIYKASQGQTYRDKTYAKQRALAAQHGFLWGAYHFADGTDVTGQVENFIRCANPVANDLICLDFEENGDSTMTLAGAKGWIQTLEKELGRPNQVVLYSGNLIKETLGTRSDPFWSAHRLWLAQYGSSPSWPPTWEKPWLWQFTGDGQGPEPHTMPGCADDIDVNSYAGTPAELSSEWATGAAVMPPEPPEPTIATIVVIVPKGVKVEVRDATLG